MSYTLDIDPLAEQQIASLPSPAIIALTDAFAVLQLVPWNGLPLNRQNPGGAVRQLPFSGLGLITYLILGEQRRVDVLIVIWAG